MRCTQDAEVQELLASDSYAFLTDLGINVVKAKVDTISILTNAVVRSCCIYSCKGELDDILKGLESVGMAGLLQGHPHAFQGLFLAPPSHLTSDFLQDLFDMDLSLNGSNTREVEDETALFWANFLQEFDEEGAIATKDSEGVHTGYSI